MFWPLGPDSTLQVFMATQMSNIVQLRHMLMLNLWVTDDYLITYRTLCVTGGSPTQESRHQNTVAILSKWPKDRDPENHWVWTWFLYTTSYGHIYTANNINIRTYGQTRVFWSTQFSTACISSAPAMLGPACPRTPILSARERKAGCCTASFMRSKVNRLGLTTITWAQHTAPGS